MQCPECESFIDISFPETDLIFWLPLEYSHEKVMSLLKESNFKYEVLETQVIRASLTTSSLKPFLIQIGGTLTGQELRGSNALALPKGTEPDFRNLARTMTLERMVGLSGGQWLRQMIQEDRFTSFFQPIIWAETGELKGYEALFRGLEHDGSILSPGYIFDTAETAGMMFQVDLAGRRSAVQNAAKQKIGDARLFINFNPTAIYDPSYCLRTTVSACEELGLRPQQIVFEVTETDEVTDVNHLRGILSFYRKAGFRVALDDVGAGYSGLNLLRDLEPDFIKIDRYLIIDIDADEFKQNIVGHLIAMAHTLRIKVIAEGIETKAESDWLKKAGVDLVQGYYYARPNAELLSDEQKAGVKEVVQA